MGFYVITFVMMRGINSAHLLANWKKLLFVCSFLFPLFGVGTPDRDKLLFFFDDTASTG